MCVREREANVQKDGSGLQHGKSFFGGGEEQEKRRTVSDRRVYEQKKKKEVRLEKERKRRNKEEREKKRTMSVCLSVETNDVSLREEMRGGYI